jgi:AraC-like DNA-binding protein
MTVVWRASDQASRDRLDYMRSAVADSVAPFDLYPEDPTLFECEIRAARVGAVTVVDIQAPPSQAVRPARLISRSDPELCTIHVQLSGRPIVEQGDRQSSFAPGDLTLVDLSRPTRVVSPARSHRQVSVVLSRSLLPFGRKRTDAIAGVALPGRAGTCALLSGLVRQMVRDLDGYGEDEKVRIGTAFLDLTAAALSASIQHDSELPPDTRRRALLLQIHAFIGAGLGDPELSPSMIAAAHHISLRYLHLLFETQDTTVAESIRRRRLEQCRRDLADPRLADVPVAAIGARHGFRDASAFNRLFRRQQGVAPGEFRRMCLS